MLPSSLLVLGALSGLLLAHFKEWRPGIWIFKPLASTGFILASLSRDAATSPIGRVLLVAQALYWLGDVLLIPRSKKIFLGGMCAFMLGHLVLGGLLLSFGATPKVLIRSAAALLPAVVLGIRWLRPHLSERMQTLVPVYAVVLTMLAAIACAAAWTTGCATLAIAGLTFLTSDVAVARNRFVSPGLINRLWGLPLYYGAQLLFVLALAGR